MLASRRNFLMATTAVAAAPLLKACSANIDVIGTLAAFYQKVQEGVAAACAAAGKLVPTIDAIMATVAQLLGVALNDANLPQAVGILQKVVDSIAGKCPTAPPSGIAGPRPTITAADGKQVPVFY